MNEKLVEEIFTDVLRSQNQADILKAMEKINDNRNNLTFLEFALVQNIFMNKSNELSISNILDAMNALSGEALYQTSDNGEIH